MHRLSAGGTQVSEVTPSFVLRHILTNHPGDYQSSLSSFFTRLWHNSVGKPRAKWLTRWELSYREAASPKPAYFESIFAAIYARTWEYRDAWCQWVHILHKRKKKGRKEKVPVTQCHRRHNKISNSEAGRPAKSLGRSPRRTGRTGYVGAPGGEQATGTMLGKTWSFH